MLTRSRDIIRPLRSISIPANTNAARGVLKNFNTVEDFRNADKQALFNVVAEEVGLRTLPFFRPAIA